MCRSFTDMDDMLRKNNQPIKRAKQTPGEYDTCNDPNDRFVANGWSININIV